MEWKRKLFYIEYSIFMYKTALVCRMPIAVHTIYAIRWQLSFLIVQALEEDRI